jgi:hypothetical protein
MDGVMMQGSVDSCGSKQDELLKSALALIQDAVLKPEGRHKRILSALDQLENSPAVEGRSKDTLTSVIQLLYEALNESGPNESS